MVYKNLEKEITISNVENCLHVLSTPNKELENTYNYIVKNYGIRYLNGITSILRVPTERIQEIEERFKGKLKKKNYLQAAYSPFSIEEIEKIVEVCRKNGIEVTGSVFYKSAEEIERIVLVCKENGIEITGAVFKRTSEEIEKIVEVCQKNGIEVTGNVFNKPAEEIEKIVEVCKKNGIEVTGSIFLKSAKELEENIKYIRENFGEKYLTGLIVSKNKKNLQEILPYLQEKGVLETVINSPSILTLKLEEIKSREEYIEKIGETILSPNGRRFNSIFGLSRKKFKERLEKEKTISKESEERVGKPTNEEFEKRVGEQTLMEALKDSSQIGKELTQQTQLNIKN